jgi:hypothetical protein
MSQVRLPKLYNKYLILHFVLLFIIFHAKAETLTYTVFKGSDKIGKINISRTTKNNQTEYFFESNVKLRVILSIEVYDRMKVIFKGNQMVQADLYRTLNGKVKVNNSAVWNGRHYELKNTDNESATIMSPIHLTTANLYYNEPKNVPAVFSEKFQKMIPIATTGEKKYTLKLPNGNRTTYSYANGVCNMVEADTDWATLRFVRDIK